MRFLRGLAELSIYRKIAVLSVLALLCAELLPMVLHVGRPAHTILYQQVMLDMFLSSGIFCIFVLYLLLVGVRRNELIAVVAAGTYIDYCLHLRRLEYYQMLKAPTADSFISWGMGLGLCALLALVYRAFTSPSEREAAVDAIAIGIALPCCTIFDPFAHSLVISTTPLVYDYVVYAYDALFGFQPSFVIARESVHVLPLLVYHFVYGWLTAWMLLAQLVAYLNPRKCAVSPFLAYIILGIVGGAIYKIYPVVGVQGLCGSAVFPNGDWPVITTDPTRLIPAPDVLTRNGLPSLHMAWGLCAYWVVENYARPIRYSALVLLLLTVVATFNSGFHYVMDLFMAVPVTLAVYALTAKAGVASQRWRMVCVIGGTLMTIVWLVLLKYYPLVGLACGPATLTAMGLCFLACLAAKAYLDKLVLASLETLPEKPTQASPDQDAELS